MSILLIQHTFYFSGEFFRCGGDFKTQIQFRSAQLTRDFNQDRENFPNLARSAPRKQSDEIRIALNTDLTLTQSFDHRMSDKNRAQSAFIVELRFEREDAEHQIQPARHLFDPPAVPRPNLRTDVINNVL